MTNEVKLKFHGDIANLLRKYELKAFVGMWFSVDNKTGILHLHQPADELMKVVTTGLATKLAEFSNEFGAELKPSELKGWHPPNDEQN